jgi:hypothetical protein
MSASPVNILNSQFTSTANMHATQNHFNHHNISQNHHNNSSIGISCNQNLNIASHMSLANSSLPNFMTYSPFSNNFLSNAVNMQSGNIPSLQLQCNYSPVSMASNPSLATLRLKAREHSVALGSI